MFESDGGLLLVDKPLKWSSFDAVNKIRYLIKFILKKKMKVGHAGTLDPLATGLLIICYGKMTKQIAIYQAQTKEYTGEIKLGGITPSYDRETDVSQTFPTAHITEAEVKKAALSLRGLQMQRPPDFSAKKIGGKRAYELARQGLKTEIKENEVEVFDFDVTFNAPDMVSFRIKCSKGTYIRSMAHDLGQALNSGAYLYSLRRTAIGDFRVEDARSIEEIETDLTAISESMP
jgi:tRNA pseudouridine55 synthase